MGRLLEVQDGTPASAKYYPMVIEGVGAAEKARIRAAILR